MVFYVDDGAFKTLPFFLDGLSRFMFPPVIHSEDGLPINLSDMLLRD